MFTAVDWHALLTCPSQWKISLFNKDSAALNVRNQMGISVLLRSEGGNCLQDLNNFYSHFRENCVQAIENSLNVLATKN